MCAHSLFAVNENTHMLFMDIIHHLKVAEHIYTI